MNQPITFLHPHCTLAGGSTTFLLEVVRRLARAGRRVVVVSVRSTPDLVADARRDGVEFVDVGGPLPSSIGFWLTYPLVFTRMYRATRQTGARVVVSEPFPANWWGWFYRALRPDSRLIYVCHEPTAFIFSKPWIESVRPAYMRWFLQAANPLMRWVEQRLMPLSDFVEVNSRFSLSEIRSTFPQVPAERFRLVYGGIDTMAFYPRPAIMRQPQIVMVGTLNRFKNVDWVIRAVGQLRQQLNFAHLRLVIKGKGVEKIQLQRLIDSLGLTDAVNIIDAYYNANQLAELLCQSQIFVHAAHNEPFGLSTIEALACGTPAVVTGTGGTAETVLDGQSGLYFRSGDIDHLTAQLARLLTDDALWQRLSTGAIEHASHFSWEETNRQFLEIVHEAEQSFDQKTPVR